MTRRPIDEDTKLKLHACLEEWNKNRWFTSVYEIRDNGKKIAKIGIRPITEQDRVEEQELATKMLRNKEKLNYGR